MTMKNVTRLLALVAILTAAALPASAQWGPEEEKNCFLNGKTGTITLSGQATAPRATPPSSSSSRPSRRASSCPARRTAGPTRSYFLDAEGHRRALRRPVPGRDLRQEGRVPAQLHLEREPQLAVEHRAHAVLHRSGDTGVLHAPGRHAPGAAERLRALGHADREQPGRHRHGAGEPDRPRLLRRRELRQHEPAHVRPALRAQDRPGRHQRSPWAGLPLRRQLLPRDARRRQEHDVLRRPELRGRDPDRVRDRRLPLRGEFAKGRFFLAASVDFSNFKNEVHFVEIDNPERLQMENPTNGRAIVNDVDLLPALDAPGQQGLPGSTSPAASRCPRATRSRARSRPAT